jgi:hypothetical protein
VHGDVFGKKETGRNALKVIGSILSRFGIKLERKKETKQNKSEPKVSKEVFKPTGVTSPDDFPSAETTALTYSDSTDTRGFSVDGAEYKVVRRNKQRLVEAENINEIFLARGMNQPEAEQLIKY